MRKLLTVLVMACAALAGCDLHNSDNGDLDGLWQLRAVDTLLTGGTQDMHYSQIAWGVQGTILEVRCGADTSVVLQFRHTADSLFTSHPYISNRDEGDIEITDVSLLQPYGIGRLEEHYKILHLSAGSMTLQSDWLRLYFRKY